MSGKPWTYSPSRVVDPPCQWCGQERSAHLGMFEQCRKFELQNTESRWIARTKNTPDSQGGGA